VLRFSDARNFGRTLTGLLLFAGPGLFLIATVIQPKTDYDNKLRELNAIAAHKGMYLFSGILFLIGGLLFVAVGPGLMRLFRGPRGVTAGQVGGALLMIGGTITAGWYALGAVEYEMVNQTGLDRQALATFLHKTNSGPSSILPLVIVFMVGIVIGSILLAVANWRTRVAPAWASVAIVVGGILAAVGNSDLITIISSAVLLVGFGAIGVSVLSMSDEEWDSPRIRASKAEEAPATSAPAPAS
jgi:hypothetical protein